MAGKRLLRSFIVLLMALTTFILPAVSRGLTTLFDFTKIAHTTQSHLARHISKNALNPVLFLCLISTPLCFGTAYLFKGDPVISRWLVIVGIIPILVASVVYIGFAIFKPDKLQSESYQLKHEAIQLVAQKGKGFMVPTVSLEAITNPAAGLLGSGEETERK